MTNEELLKEIASLPAKARHQVEDYISYVREQYKRTARQSVDANPLNEEEFVGMWADREDMRDSAGWVRNLRETHWKQ